MHLQGALSPARIVNETQLPESVHKEANPRTGRSNHFGQCLLADLRDHSFGNSLLAKMSKQ